ncbi:ABC1 family protein [Rhizodiscina lignyota]|uniref:ABC1 family protein n=1 Tax=Rhizodiscina lignyota TaxID=1504668 RepID=A0A9P4IH62_9PEZI|nr:ABC1 family protein [Rhizodiscina lignyota]
MSSAPKFFSLFHRAASRWTCRTCHTQQRAPAVQSRLNYATRSTPWRKPPAPKPKAKQRRRIILLASAGAGVGALAFTDQAKHAATAVERSGRVFSTLFVCINDYRVTLGQQHDNPEDREALLKKCHKRCAERTLVALEKNGSIFIKLGQHLSSLNYLLPSEWCDTFVPLQDKCPVSSYESIEEMVLKDTGHYISDFFSEFEREPIGAASLAQVHRAVLKDTGERVAVKVQHPALDEWAPLDLALTHLTFSTIKRFFPEYDLTWLSEEMMISLPQELDFNLEAHNAERAREYFAPLRDAPLVIPGVRFSQRRILVMEYVTGHRPDDLKYLDDNGIDRDEVSAALARIFNEMIFGRHAPLHCDPHGGNIAIRYREPTLSNHYNFDIILYDHGLYRDIPDDMRLNYAKLWLAVLEADEKNMRKYAHDVAGIDDEHFPLFASAITGREYDVVRKEGGVSSSRSVQEKENITAALTTKSGGDEMSGGMLQELVQLLGSVPRVMLLILKTNDLTRSLDESLQTRQGPVRTFLILARYASRTVYEDQLEQLRSSGSLLWPKNWKPLLAAWYAHVRMELKLNVYESWLWIRKVLRLRPVTM